MKMYLKNYIKKLEQDIENHKKYSEKEIEILFQKILFFQHERIIHLWVTLSFVLFTLLFMVLGMLSYLFLILFAILLVFDLFYIFHYFFLENHIQYLYKLYDKIIETNKNK